MANDVGLKISISSLLDSSGFDKAGKATNDLGASFQGLEGIAKKAAGAIAGYFAFESFKEGIKSALDYAEAINHVRQSAGMSADQVYALSAQAKLADVSFEAISKATSKFNKNLGEASMGAGDARKALQNLGLSLKDSDGHMIGSYEQLSKIADIFADMPDGASKTTMAMKIFGKTGAEMIPVLNQGSKALKEYAGFLNEDTTNAAENFNDSLTRIKMSSEAFYMQIVADMVPTLNELADIFNNTAHNSKEFHDTMAGGVSSVFVGSIEAIRNYHTEMESLAVAMIFGSRVVSSYTKISDFFIGRQVAQTSIIEAQTKAQELGTVATNLRSMADRASATNVINSTIVTNAHVVALEKEASAAEAAALAATKLSYEMQIAAERTGIASLAVGGLKSTVMAFAPTAALFAITEVFMNWDKITASVTDRLASISDMSDKELASSRKKYTDLVNGQAGFLDQFGGDSMNRSRLLLKANEEVLQRYHDIIDIAPKTSQAAQQAIKSIKTLYSGMDIPKDASDHIKQYTILIDKLKAKESKQSDNGLRDFDEEATKLKQQQEAAEKLKQAYLSINKDIANLTGTEHEKAIATINETAEKYRKEKVDELTIAKYISSAKTALIQKETEEQNKLLADHYATVGDDDASYYIKLSSEIDAMVKKGTASYDEINTYREDSDRKYLEKKAQLEFQADQESYAAQVKFIEDQNSAKIEYYKTVYSTSTNLQEQLSAYSDSFIIEESDKLQKLADAGAYTNEQMLKIWALDNEKFRKEQWERDNKFWVDLFENINKAMENQFFDAMTGKFKSFGSWLKDFWGSITESMTRGLSKTLADTIMGTGSNSSGGIANWFKSYGGFGSVFGSFATPSALVGATTDGAGFTTTAGGTVYDAAGQITKGGSDLAAVTDALSAASGISAIYSAATGAIADTVATNFGIAGSYLGELTGSASIADGVGSFGMGLSSPFAGYGAGGAAGIGSVVGGAALGGLGGYALGSLGDALMGKDTKAGTYGAIGGAAGAVVGSVVPVIGTALGAVVGAALGSLIGGIFGGGKTSQVGSGFDVTANTGSTQNIRDYVKIHQSGGWFSGDREWYEYGALTTQQKTQIKGTFDTYNYLLEQLGSSNKVYLQAGKYTASAFNDALAKSFMEGFTETSITDEIYSYWSNYATSISKTVAEALTTTVGTYITESRTFQEWKLGSGTTDQLKFTSDYLAKDLQSLESQMGVSGITVENYLSKYEEAMKTAFTPETINTWKSLGDALMAATDANQKYIDSLNQTTSLIPTDMMLSKGVDGTQIFQSMTNQNDTLKYSFSEMITVLKKILFNQQFGNTITGTPMP